MLSGNENTDNWGMCLEMMFYHETLLKGEWSAKLIMEGKDYTCWVPLHPQQNTQKCKQQQNTERNKDLQIEVECHTPATQQMLKEKAV